MQVWPNCTPAAGGLYSTTFPVSSTGKHYLAKVTAVDMSKRLSVYSSMASGIAVAKAEVRKGGEYRPKLMAG